LSFTALSYRSGIYTVGSCENFGGYHVAGRCYYNSSYCPANHHSINAQCYRRSDARYSPSTCRHIGGHYYEDHSSNTNTSRGTCYYNTFNCSAGFIVDRIACYMNRSATYRLSSPVVKWFFCDYVNTIFGSIGYLNYLKMSYCSWSKANVCQCYILWFGCMPFKKITL